MKFSMSEAWRDATAMMSANREVLLIISGIFFFLPSLGFAIAMGDVQDRMMADPQNAPAYLIEIAGSLAVLFVIVFAILLFQIVGYLAMLALLRDHDRPTVGEALQAGVTGLLPAFATYLIFTIGLGLAGGLIVLATRAAGSPAVAALGVLVMVVGAAYIAIKCSLAGPVIAIDKVHNPATVLARSWTLTKGNSYRLFLFYLLLGIVYLVISLVVGVVIAALLVVVGPSAALLVNGILSGLIGAVATVVFVAVVAAVHRQLSGPSAAAVSETFE